MTISNVSNLTGDLKIKEKPINLNEVDSEDIEKLKNYDADLDGTIDEGDETINASQKIIGKGNYYLHEKLLRERIFQNKTKELETKAEKALAEESKKALSIIKEMLSYVPDRVETLYLLGRYYLEIENNIDKSTSILKHIINDKNRTKITKLILYNKGSNAALSFHRKVAIKKISDSAPLKFLNIEDGNLKSSFYESLLSEVKKKLGVEKISSYLDKSVQKALAEILDKMSDKEIFDNLISKEDEAFGLIFLKKGIDEKDANYLLKAREIFGSAAADYQSNISFGNDIKYREANFHLGITFMKLVELEEKNPHLRREYFEKAKIALLRAEKTNQDGLYFNDDNKYKTADTELKIKVKPLLQTLIMLEHIEDDYQFFYPLIAPER